MAILTYEKVAANTELYALPRIVAYNRLEARPRTRDFTRSLRAEVRDPLWMLARQWQFGEFRGEDAASPVTARIAYRHMRNGLVSLRDAPAFRFDPATLPLESRVERERIPLTHRIQADGKEFSDVLYAVRWGKRLLDLMRAAHIDEHYARYLDRFPIRVLERDPEAEAIARSARHICDGVAVWRAVESGRHVTWLDDLAIAPAVAAGLKNVAKAFADECTAGVERLFSQPASAQDSAWVSNHLEYQFATAPQPMEQESLPTLRADQYSQGQLDWYSVDAFMNRPLAAAAGQQPPAKGPDDVDEETVESFLPAPVRFKGQPQPRFWEMEEAQTDFGKIDTSTTGLLHLLLAEFGLIYSNDWFMLPHPMEINTLCEVRGILVTDTFGRHTFIRAAGRGPETAWQRFSMFHLTEHGKRPDAAGNLFYLAPAAGHALESQPIERVNFLRDEMANMVWAMEAIVPSQIGQGMSGYEAAGPPRAEPARTIENEEVKIAYVAGTTVPANWVPFIPVHDKDSVSEIRLQRARMASGTFARGQMLREAKSPYFIEEEEVPRAGAYVERSWQRVRWLSGRTLLWVGRRKTSGRGEGSSSLSFDRIVDLKKADPV